MNLLLRRSQSSAALFSFIPLRIGSGVIFNLTAELELDEGEALLMKKYDFNNAPLVLSDPIEDLKMAFRPALILGLFGFVVGWLLISFSAAIALAFLVTLTMTVVYFRTLREQIIVRDLLNGGRTFRCDSIVQLIRKEAFIEGVCEYLRQVLESARHWHDREVIAILPLDKDAAKRAVLGASRG